MSDRIRRVTHLLAVASIMVVHASSSATANQPDVSGLRSRTDVGSHRNQATISKHWTIPPQKAERAFARAPLRVLTEEYAGRGVTGASRVTLELLEEGKRVEAKWKPTPRRLDALNNSPRREIAAYEIQKLFLDPSDYVVPTSKLRCLRARDFAQPDRHRSVTIRGTNCRIGVLSLWLDNVTLPDPLLDPDRFSSDPIYARYLADFNLATYLMNHKDGRRGNFLVAQDERRRRVFAIDNGVAFSGFVYNWFVPNWKRLRVPALRKASVDRLRSLKRSDVDSLGVVAQLRWVGRRSIRTVPPTPNFAPERAVRAEGRVIQIGLDQREIENLWARIEHLIEDVDRGRVEVF